MVLMFSSGAVAAPRPLTAAASTTFPAFGVPCAWSTCRGAASETTVHAASANQLILTVMVRFSKRVDKEKHGGGDHR